MARVYHRDARGRFVSGGGSGGGSSPSSGGGLVGLTAKTQLDRRKVKTATDQAVIRTMPRAGSYIRGIARRSIRRSLKPSLPGQPPRTRRGNLKRAIRYDVGPDRQSVAIGPARENAGRIWQTLEYGGEAQYYPLSTRSIHVGGWGPIRPHKRKGRGNYRVQLTTPAQVSRALALQTAENVRRKAAAGSRILPRPFMRPALATARPALAELYRNSVRSR